MKPARILVPAGALLLALSIAAAASAQSLTDRVSRSDGDVRFSFNAKPGVCGDGAATIYIRDGRGGRSVSIRGNNWSTTTSSRHADEWSDCEYGPVRVAVTTENGTVTSLRTYVSGEWRPRQGATDLGRVSARDAIDFLLTTAERGAPKKVSSDAIFAATLADSADVWRRLLRMARNTDLNKEVRNNAVFWLGQDAAEAATAGLKELIDDEGEIEVRNQAVFALSQRPKEESIPALISLVRRDNVDPRIKKTALFWLAQKDDPRAIAVFEEILTRR